jgi:hypothetical protein
MVYSYCRGHKIYYDNKDWRYCDSNELLNNRRECAKCGKPPTIEGYDNCLGHIPNVISACCGHGAEDKYIMFEVQIR